MPGKLNAAGKYEESAELDKGAIFARDTSVNPRTFGLVAIATSSNLYPGRFEFVTRSALADLGVTKVVNGRELLAFAQAHPKLKDIESLQEAGVLKRISAQTGPILLIEISYIWDGNVRRYVRMRVTDTAQGKQLFVVEFGKAIMMNADAEAVYPVLNAFRAWYLASAGEKV
jgi:hypothetical protein